MTYLITFSCYGGHLHGQEAGSVDREHNVPGTRTLDADPDRARAEQQRMCQAPYVMDEPRRAVVLAALVKRCQEREWSLLAAHVRTSHVHLVVEAEGQPDRVMNDLKSYASGCLNRSGLDATERKRWARHGSTRWLWERRSVVAAIRYVVEGQGDQMAVFESPGH